MSIPMRRAMRLLRTLRLFGGMFRMTLMALPEKPQHIRAISLRSSSLSQGYSAYSLGSRPGHAASTISPIRAKVASCVSLECSTSLTLREMCSGDSSWT